MKTRRKNRDPMATMALAQIKNLCIIAKRSLDVIRIVLSLLIYFPMKVGTLDLWSSYETALKLVECSS